MFVDLNTKMQKSYTNAASALFGINYRCHCGDFSRHSDDSPLKNKVFFKETHFLFLWNIMTQILGLTTLPHLCTKVSWFVLLVYFFRHKIKISIYSQTNKNILSELGSAIILNIPKCSHYYCFS